MFAAGTKPTCQSSRMMSVHRRKADLANLGHAPSSRRGSRVISSHLAVPGATAKSGPEAGHTRYRFSALLSEVRDGAPVDLWIGKPRKAVVNFLGVWK